MNVSDIQMRVKRTFGDLSGVQVTDTDIYRWINDGQRQIVMNNEGLLEVTASSNTSVGVQEYPLPANLLILKSISFKGSGEQSYFRLKRYTLTEFNEYIDGWNGGAYNQGSPSMYATYAGNILLFPIPDTDLADSIKVYYNRKPVEVNDVTDTPDLPELYHEALVKYCLQQAYEMDEDFEAAVAKNAEWNSDIAQLRGRDDWTAQEAYPTITILSEDL